MCYCFVGLSLSFVFGSFFVVVREKFLRVGGVGAEGYGEGRGNYVIISFLKKNSLIQFAIID